MEFFVSGKIIIFAVETEKTKDESIYISGTGFAVQRYGQGAIQK